MPVLGAQGRRRGGRLGDLVGHALAVLRVDELEEEIRLRQPLLCRIAEQRRDLRADVEALAALAERVDVGDDREVLREGAVLGLDLTPPGVDPVWLPDVGCDHERAGRLVVRPAERCHGQRDGDLLASFAPVNRRRDLEPLRGVHGDERGRDNVLSAQDRERLADRLVGAVSVDVLRAPAPADDRAFRVDGDDRLRAGLAQGGELEVEVRSGPRRLAPGCRQPAGESADREPRG